MRLMLIWVMLSWSILVSLQLQANAQECERCSCKLKSASVYVPVYSHVSFGDSLRPFNIAANVTIRNLDLVQSIRISAVEYHDSTGRLIRSFMAQPIELKPLASVAYRIKESDVEGGSGAGIIVKWSAENPVIQPLVESVMIGTASGQGISFSSQGRLIESSDPS